MASGPITSWQIDAETVETSGWLFWGAPKSLQMVTVAMKLKDAYSLEGNLWPAFAKLLQSCLILCDPIDGSPPGSPIAGILQARTLEWIAISFSNMTNLDSILKSRYINFANQSPSSQSYGFSSSHIWMWELDFKESWAPKNWCFWTVVSLGLQRDPTSPFWRRSALGVLWKEWC